MNGIFPSVTGEKTGSFNLSEQFFVIESSMLADLRGNGEESHLYGYCIIDSEIVDNAFDLGARIPDGTGAYVLIQRRDDVITITQDFMGSYGLCLYDDGNFWAISNSFLYLIDYVKKNHKISLNTAYADYLLASDLCSTSYSETLVSEIKLLDRRAQINIDLSSADFAISYIDYCENSIDINSEMGIATLDAWRAKWARILMNILNSSQNVQCDLSGGFDTRLVLSMFAGKDLGELLNCISIHTIEDTLHTHASDYEYAKRIAELLGFSLNRTEMLSSSFYYYDIETIMNISLYLKLGFHKQMYFKALLHRDRKYSLTGFGGECVRSYWNMSRDEYTDSFIKRGKRFTRGFESSISSILDASFNEMINVRNSINRPIPESDILLNLYRDTRCRNHFGRSTVESFMSNCVNLSPLLDSDLHRLKLTTHDCSDKNLLCAIIIGRYCPELLEMDFEGGRSIDSATIQEAKRISEKYPFDSTVQYAGTHCAHQRSIIECSSLEGNKKVDRTVPDELLLSSFNHRMGEAFDALYGENVRHSINDKVKRTSYFPLSEVYCAIAIGAISDLQRSQINLALPTVQGVLNSDGENRAVALLGETFDDNPIIKRYKAARVDIRSSDENAQFEIHDYWPDTDVSQPAWLNKKGFGYVLTLSRSISLISLRCTSSGLVRITLRGVDLRTKNGRHVPVWVEYKSLQINGLEYLETPTLVNHDQPRNFDIMMHEGDEFAILVTYSPANPVSDELFEKDYRFRSRYLKWRA